MQTPNCPKCGRVAFTKATRFGPMHLCCGLRSFNGKPLVSDAVLAMRRAAHAAFDPLWTSRRVHRSTAYRMLAEHLGLTGEQCHMGLMDLETLVKVPGAVICIEMQLERDGVPVDENKALRRQASASLPKCRCGNALSKKRWQDRINVCPACEREPRRARRSSQFACEDAHDNIDRP